VAAYLEGFHLARNSGTDGILRSVILSRFPITREQKWLDGVLLDDFGYDGRFTRDLFEAEIEVPNWPAPLHVFTTHLKSGFDSNSVSRRAAEALAISNFVVNTFYPAFTNHPFVLTGDLNEDHVVHANSGGGVVGKLTDEAVGLRLTDPVNPATGNHRTFSSRSSLSSRLD
jgi:endonuclease/exonuclease/phosphatase family metal-dependent hydrolase